MVFAFIPRLFMINCVSVDNMRLSDQMTIDMLRPSMELIYQAAYGVYKAANWFGRIAIVAGSGHSGDDGFALACILQRHGLPSTLFTISSRLSRDSSFSIISDLTVTIGYAKRCLISAKGSCFISVGLHRYRNQTCLRRGLYWQRRRMAYIM